MDHLAAAKREQCNRQAWRYLGWRFHRRRVLQVFASIR
jgi:hypothetical protein